MALVQRRQENIKHLYWFLKCAGATEIERASVAIPNIVEVVGL